MFIDILSIDLVLLLFQTVSKGFGESDKLLQAYNGLRKSIVDNVIVLYLYDEEKELISIVRVIYAKMDYIKEI